MAAYTKTTTGLTGLAVDPLAGKKLTRLYTAILKKLAEMPQSAAYRRHTEPLIKERLSIVTSEPDLMKVESKINCGQIEEVVLQAERELNLARNMKSWKAWEPLIEEAPKNQWKWPL